jgi:deoxycytidylate deaminase
MSLSRKYDKLTAFVTFARELSNLTTCKRGSCGAIVFPPNFSEVAAIGYNSPPSGSPNESCTGEEGTCGCVHAEANAVIKLKDRTREWLMFSTTFPCQTCAGLIVNCKVIRAVIWERPYRNEDGATVLARGDVVQCPLSSLLADPTKIDELLRRL